METLDWSARQANSPTKSPDAGNAWPGTIEYVVRFQDWRDGGQVEMKIGFEDDSIVIDAALIAPPFGVAPSEVPGLMREGAITSLCETGIGDVTGEYRLSFFYQGRRIRLRVNASGEVPRQSIVDYGDLTYHKQCIGPADKVSQAHMSKEVLRCYCFREIVKYQSPA